MSYTNAQRILAANETLADAFGDLKPVIVQHVQILGPGDTPHDYSDNPGDMPWQAEEADPQPVGWVEHIEEIEEHIDGQVARVWYDDDDQSMWVEVWDDRELAAQLLESAAGLEKEEAGRLIKRARTTLGLTQEQFTETLDIANQHRVSEYETGKRGAGKHTLKLGAHNIRWNR